MGTRIYKYKRKRKKGDFMINEIKTIKESNDIL
jgi:hypothetical protein